METKGVDLSSWSGAPRPERIVLEGAYARLEPLDARHHAGDLLHSALADGAEERFRYLFDTPPPDQPSFARWLETAAASQDPLFFAVIDKATGRAEGRQALMRIDPAHGVIEIGNILWGPAIARSPVTTEAFFLFASYVFDRLGYRRFEWKCDARNLPSRRAAERFGFSFEGIFRHHMVVKGQNRDTAWFSIIGPEWPRLSAALSAWLDASNFDEAGQQRRRLEDFR
ncbi:MULTISPECIES: GNAT family protein [Rhodomicrobium]|uniref:GNAT family N-acetyltransferase n=1 Tax=Rhodomicrobium TaxID=1068 RepID=UPI0014835D35|nr:MULTISPECIES: GNAT family protein [Rhodomicrobium]